MKTIITKLLCFSVFAVLLIPTLSHAQSISIGSVSATSFCAGDPLSVTITVTGTWGHNNAFTLQLSNTSGTFDNGFTKLGAVSDTAPGSFAINTTIPPTTPYSSHYRVRVIGAFPYTESADNGSDILIGEKPSHVTWKPSVLETAVAVGVPITFNTFAFSITADTEHVDFGAGANPSSAVVTRNSQGASVTYNSSGLKTIIIETVAAGGCSVKDTFRVYAFGCDNPVVPHDAVILSRDTVFDDNQHSNMTFWLNPGVSLTLTRNESDTIFAEAGSSVSGQNGGQTDDIVYLKKGASSDPDFYGVVIYQPGASLENKNSGSIRTIECADLTFDYSVAPPNSALHINEAVPQTGPLPLITVSPNPTSGMITVEGIPSATVNISVMNLLGATVMNITKPNSSNLQLDLAKLTPGTYYVRFAMPNAVITKKIIRE